MDNKIEDGARHTSERTERYRVRLGFWQAIWGTFISGGVAVAIPAAVETFKAHLEYLKSIEENKLKENELRIKDRESNDRNVSGFITTALNQDIELRIRFSEYLSYVAADEKKKDWEKLLKALQKKRDEIREAINEGEERATTLSVASNKNLADQITLEQIQRELSWKYAEVGYAKRDTSFSVSRLNSDTASNLPDALAPDQFKVAGIDVSKYQGDVDWAQVRDSGISFAYIKATEGIDYLDPKLGTCKIWRNCYWCIPFCLLVQKRGRTTRMVYIQRSC